MVERATDVQLQAGIQDPLVLETPHLMQVTEFPVFEHTQQPEYSYPKEFEGVGEALDYLLAIHENPQLRTSETIAVSEAIVDVFYEVAGRKPGREGTEDELIIKDKPEINLGGGTNAIRGVAPFARDVHLVTRIGSFPPYTQELDDQMRQLPGNVTIRGAIDQTSNAVKIRYVENGKVVGHPINHVPSRISEEAEQAIIEELDSLASSLQGHETIVVSDYGRGISSPNIMGKVDEIVRQNPSVRVIIDPRPSGTDADMKFNVTNAVVTPNKQEAEHLAGTSIIPDDMGSLEGSAYATAQAILDKYDQLHAALVTLDEHGAVYLNRDGMAFSTEATVPNDHVQNPSGAGDTVVATLALLEQHYGEKQAVETAMWLAGSAVIEPNTSTLSPTLIKQTQSRLLHGY